MNYHKHKNALRIFKILSNANRLKILHMLAASPDQKLTVTQIVEKLNLTQGNVSAHLVMMRRAEVLKATQTGMNMYYSIKDQEVFQLTKSMLT